MRNVSLFNQFLNGLRRVGAYPTPDGTELVLLVKADGSKIYGSATIATAGGVALTGAQTIAGVKTFSDIPVFPAASIFPGMWRIRINADLAAAGSTVSDAAQLLEGFTVVTGANGTLGVKLPAAPTPGMICVIKGTTAGVLKVWPDAAATINAIGSNGALPLASGAIPAIFIAKTATQWYSIPLVPS